MREFNFKKLAGLYGDDASAIASAIFKTVGETMPETVEGLTNLLAAKAQQLWQQSAIEVSESGWGSKYARSIKIDPAKGTGPARVYVDESMKDTDTNKPISMFVEMVENGVKTWSIRDALLNSKRVKNGPNGKYIIVPLRQRTPGAQKPRATFSGVMPDEIYDLVKGGKVQLTGQEFGTMAGLVKADKPGHSAYFIFRVVSEKTPKDAWQYPAKPATPVYEKVLEKVDAMIDMALKYFCEAIVKELKGSGA